MLQISNEIEEAAIIQDIPWTKRMFRIIIPIQKSAIISGYMLPFMTCLRELSLFLLLCTQGFILSTTLDYFDRNGSVRVLERDQPDPDRYDPDLQYVSQ